MECFVFAMEKEAKPLLDQCQILKTETFGFTKCYTCSLEGRTFLVAISGIGKGFAAACVASVAAHYQVEAIVNGGVAGSLDGKKAPILSAVIAKHVVEHDLDTSPIGDPVGLVSGINIVEIPVDEKLAQGLNKACKKVGVSTCRGVISSGDTFFRHEDPRREKAHQRFDSLSMDMESGPFGQIAYAHHIPFASMRVISDCEDPEVEYAQNVGKASELVCQILKEYILR